ncbi:hypothetical protein LCGC14_0570710 [marine sediment metagenome]|uniref:Entericidin EcnAB n=1 Tax=marine sediment metagenome TaxID=412755 RepID=A0A0F9U5L8_9ZZZZ|nr:entericidin A/B family lipoprotein [Methylophaga sp.]HEC58809.1 entericidin A/B family lipoprotein [Methylophaga sp.]
MKIKYLTTLFAVLMISAISGCNTMQGAGEDIEAGGEKIQDAAQ